MTRAKAKRRRVLAGEEGQVLVVTALIVLVLLGFLALIFDAGLAYASRREQQNAADNAALAGTRLVALGTSDDGVVSGEVAKYVGHLKFANGQAHSAQYIDSGRNPIAGCDVGACGSVPAGAAGVQVSTSTDQTGFFSQLLGQATYEVGASAAAVSTPAEMPLGLGGLVPLAVPSEDFEASPSPPPYNLWSPQYAQVYEDAGLPSNFKGAVDYSDFDERPCTGNINAKLGCWAAYGLQGELRPGYWLPIVNGDHAENIADSHGKSNQEGLHDMIVAQNLSDSGGQYGILLVPLFDQFEANHNFAADADPHNNGLGTGDALRLSGFAAFKVYLADLEANAADALEFTPYIVASGTPSGGGLPWGPRVIRLVPQEPGPTATPLPAATPTTAPTATATATATPTATPAGACAVAVTGPDFAGTAQNASKFDLDMTWSTDVTVNWTFEWGTNPGSYGSSWNGTASSGSRSWNNLYNGTYYWHFTATKAGCATGEDLTGSYRFP
ncbi:MAG: Tad domain-containing protein [Dehalococcoidales bacterium]|nr:Tad domain-containing protein [Dehalococcoidales bacterium]